MSVETISSTLETRDFSESQEKARTLEILHGILAVTTEKEAREKGDEYQEIARIFLDAHQEKVDRLTSEKLELIMGAILDSPEDSFRAEFLQLQILFDTRAIATNYQGGMVQTEFCTQDHERQKLDYVFRHVEFSNGAEKYEIRKVFDMGGTSRPVTMTWHNGQLSVIDHQWHRGETKYVEVEGERRERILAELFYDTISASALQIERSADEREENDDRAKGYLRALITNGHILQ